MHSIRDVIRGNVATICYGRGVSMRKWCAENGVRYQSLFNARLVDGSPVSGMSVGSLLDLCDKLNVSPNELLEGLYGKGAR